MHDSALVVPFRRGMRSNWSFHAGVFDREGRVLPDTEMRMLHRTADPLLVDLEDVSSNAEHLDGTWLFCGIASAQIGHVITRSLGMLWATEALSKDVGLLFAAMMYTEEQHGFLSKMLESLGIKNAYRIVKSPTRVDALITAPDLFSENSQGKAEPDYAAWLRDRVPQRSASPVGSKVYLTRERLAGTVGRHLCEDTIERNLARAGFDIVAPEKYSLEEQFAIYAHADVVISADSSALHILAFAIRDGARVVVLHRRPEVPELISNQLASFTKARVHYVDVIEEVIWPSDRSDSVSLVKLDFKALRERLIDLDVIEAGMPWTTPTKQQFDASQLLGRSKGQHFMTDDERPKYLRNLRRKKLKEKAMKDTIELDPIPEINGLRYFRVLKRLHEKLNPDWYLEVGTFTGKSLALARCNTISVDPEFQIKFPVINPTGKQMFFFQQTSDSFFEDGFIKKNKITVDFAFLDGMHLFEFLLRDFIAAEKVMSKDGVIALHDCCPTTEYMATRDFHDGPWTGDVWKTLLILLRYRPDLKIDVTTAGGTGLVLVRNLNPRSQVLSKKYDALVDEYMDKTLSGQDGGIGGYYRNFELVDPVAFLDTL